MPFLLATALTDPLTLTVAAMIVLAVAAGVLHWRSRRSPEEAPELPDSPIFTGRPMLFTPAEQLLLATLEQVMPAGFRIYGKVRLADVFQVRQEVPSGEQRRRFLQISSKHVDFLVVRLRDSSPACGIELDDASHSRPERAERDALVSRVFADAGLPLVRIKALRGYQPESIRSVLAPHLR